MCIWIYGIIFFRPVLTLYQMSLVQEGQQKVISSAEEAAAPQIQSQKSGP